MPAHVPARILALTETAPPLETVEIWFGIIITRQAIRRGTFVSVNHLVARIRDYVKHWNANAEPFVWTRDRRGDPCQGPPGTDQRQETRPEQLEVTQTGSRDTSGTQCAPFRESPYLSILRAPDQSGA
jgi:hypothetical protein